MKSLRLRFRLAVAAAGFSFTASFSKNDYIGWGLAAVLCGFIYFVLKGAPRRIVRTLVRRQTIAGR